MRHLLVPGLISCAMSATSFGASVEKAEMLSRYNLTHEAKVELIDVLFSKANDSDKAQSQYLLGSIAFDDNQIQLALETWRELAQKYPNSAQAKIVKDRIAELAEIVGESSKESIQNAVALSYLRSGNFWSSGRDVKFTIDNSWIPNVEVAIKWYDKVISEFPKTTASRIAHEEKIRTILGWENPGKYGSKYGIKDSFSKYIPLLLEAFAAFEKDYPTASTLQAFRYQIAQTYWSNKDWNKTREWLNKIIAAAGPNDGFYKDLAERRLQKIEY